MSTNGPRSSSLYFHHASAFGLAGQINRPIQKAIAPLTAVSLAPSGGHGMQSIDNYNVPGVLSCGAAYAEVGGSLDAANNNTYTTYATSVVENLNIWNVITADRVVSRVTVYHPPKTGSEDLSEPRFSIVGSHFDNLKIAGQKIDVVLDNESFHDSTYTTFVDGLKAPGVAKKHVLLPSNIDLTKLSESDHNYAIVGDVAKRYQQWNPKAKALVPGQHFWCSAANRRESAQKIGQKLKTGSAKKNDVPQTGELGNFGGVICVPRFGVVYLAEVLVYHNHRHLTMIRVQMCSPSSGNIDGPGAGGGGGDMPPRP